MTGDGFRQIPLDLPSRPALGRAALLVAPCNERAVAMIDAWRRWPAGKLILLGPPGSGKTHLAHVWAASAGATIVPASDLVQADLPGLAGDPVAVEDVEAITGDRAAERALLHLHNLVATSGGALLMTAKAPPRSWGLGLPDLVSRVEGAATVHIAAPDDATLRAVLLKHFADRQLAPTPATIDFILRRIERSFAGVRDAVARLDAASLVEGRSVTRPLAARVLKSDPAVEDFEAP